MRCLRLAFALVLLSSPAWAEDDPSGKKAVEAFRAAFRSDSERERMEALLDLARTGKPAAFEVITREILVHPDPAIRAAGALALAKVRAPAAEVGPALRDRLPKEEDFPEVQVAIVRAIAAVGFADARRALIDAAMRFLEEDYRFVTAEVVRAFGKLGDRGALPFLLQLLTYQGATLHGRRGPTVKASSDAAAKKIYDAKYKRFAYPQGTPEYIIRWWMPDLVEAVCTLVGEEVEGADHLRAWMKKHAREEGYSAADLAAEKLVPKKPKKPVEKSNPDSR